MIEGIVDLAFLDDGVWTIVDFKTDRELDKELDQYKRQVGLYATAIERATAQKSRGVLLRI